MSAAVATCLCHFLAIIHIPRVLSASLSNRHDVSLIQPFTVYANRRLGGFAIHPRRKACGYPMRPEMLYLILIFSRYNTDPPFRLATVADRCCLRDLGYALS